MMPSLACKKIQTSRYLYGCNASDRVNHHANGFTLVELMVVIVILAVFAGMLTMSVSSGDVRKNMAYQEHLVDSMQYLRLLSQERMQPMGIRFDVDKTGKPIAQVMVLKDAYANHSIDDISYDDTQPKNAMELTGMSSNQNNSSKSNPPTWQIDKSISLPELPEGLIVDVQANDLSHDQNSQTLNNQNRANYGQINRKIRTEMTNTANPWLTSNQLPQIIWFGTGESAAAIITMQYHNRPVGNSIQLLPNGEVVYEATP